MWWKKAFRAKPLEIAVPSERPAEYFGKYVFNREKNVQIPACAGLCTAGRRDGQRRGARPRGGRPSGGGHEALGDGAGRDPLYALVPAPDGRHGGKARCLYRA